MCYRKYMDKNNRHLVENGVKQAQQNAKHGASSVLTCGRQELVAIQRRELTAVWDHMIKDHPRWRLCFHYGA